MLQVSSNPCHTHKVTWEIKHFLRCSLRFVKHLESPEIIIDCVDLTIWTLLIFVNEEGMLSCIIKRMDNKFTVDAVNVDYSVCVAGRNDQTYFSHSGQFEATIVNRASPHIDFILLSSLEANHLQGNSLVIRAKLILKVNREKIWNRFFDKHLLKLSLDISKLLDDDAYKDLTLISGESQFKVHKCIAAVGWPFLLSLNSSVVKVDMPPEALNIILKYVYLHFLIRIEPRLQSKLLIAARKHDLPEIEDNLKNYPVDSYLVSPMNEETVIFNYDLRRILEWPETFPRQVRILPISGLTVKDLMVSFSLAKDPEGRKYLGISFQFSNFFKYRPVNVRCKMGVVNRNGFTIDSLECGHVFVNDEEWILPPYFTEEKYPREVTPDARCLKCEVLMCDGIDEDNVECVTSRYVVKRRECLANDLLRKSDALGNLLLKGVHSDVDFIIKGSILKLHRAILSARCLWFKDYMKRFCVATEARCIITLNNFNVMIMKKIIAYIYTGSITIKNKEDVSELLRAAKFFRLFMLEDVCREALGETL
ncbi:hypothetical protein NPIL_344191 [Nephila pilipes]|uniref:BTB domain-containing protein n=1 Tax=Nephila pilipes TaxID=299642 RepID=A0A8X6UL46_NEPPI|nr:hypothetical protein NPIL_344191 [Nephila pilipes]